tara:strand:- start:1156 stop:1635 length:480 start_codon:yes stop_codon:yes gene_type:complete
MSLAILASVMLCGCPAEEQKPANRLVGSWLGTVSVNEEKLEPTLSGVDGKVQLESLVETLTAYQRRLVFHADGTVQVTESSSTNTGIPDNNGEGTWKVIRSDERSMEVELVIASPEWNHQEPQLWEIQFYDRNKFRIQTGPPGAKDAIVQKYIRQVSSD